MVNWNLCDLDSSCHMCDIDMMMWQTLPLKTHFLRLHCIDWPQTFFSTWRTFLWTWGTFQIVDWSSRSHSAAENNSSWFDVQSSWASQDCLGDSKYIKIYMIFYIMSEIQQETVWSPKTTQIVGFLKKAGHTNLLQTEISTQLVIIMTS